MHQSKLTIGDEEQKTLRRINYNQTRLQLVKDVLYEAAMIEKLTGFIPAKYAESIHPHLKAVRQSGNVTELVEASKDLQKAFDGIREQLGPSFSPELEEAIDPIRKQERRNLNTLWLTLGRAEGLRFLSDLMDAYTLIDHELESNPDSDTQSRVTVREIGGRFFGPSDTSGKAQAFNHLLIHQLFGTVSVYQDGSLNNAHYVEFTGDGLQWYLGILADALHLSKDFEDKNRGYFTKVCGFLEAFVGVRRSIKGLVATMMAMFALAPEAYALDLTASSFVQAASYVTDAHGLIYENPSAGDQLGMINLAEGSATHRFGEGTVPLLLAEGSATHRFGGGIVPLLLAEGSGTHRFGEGTVPLIMAAFSDSSHQSIAGAAITADFGNWVADVAMDNQPLATLAKDVGVVGWDHKIAIQAGYDMADNLAGMNTEAVVAEWVGQPVVEPKIAVNEWFTNAKNTKVSYVDAAFKVSYPDYSNVAEQAAKFGANDFDSAWKVAATY